jgi:hypothetical protein
MPIPHPGQIVTRPDGASVRLCRRYRSQQQARTMAARGKLVSVGNDRMGWWTGQVLDQYGLPVDANTEQHGG